MENKKVFDISKITIADKYGLKDLKVGEGVRCLREEQNSVRGCIRARFKGASSHIVYDEGDYFYCWIVRVS